MERKASVILVNYNGAKYNFECIDSILNSSYENIEIIVVDNASTDNSVELLSNKYSNEIIILKSEINGGFSYANNIGIQYALDNGSEYILLLNNDTVVNKNSISCLIQESIKNGNCATCPKINYYDRRDFIWSAGGKINWITGNAVHFGINEKENNIYNKKKYVDFATGCCILLNKDIIKKIGYLEEKYFLYFEDVDYCMKINNNNIKILYCPNSIIYHKVSASTGGDETPLFIYYITRNRLLFNKKYNKNKLLFNVYFYALIVYKTLKWKISGKNNLINAMFDGIKDSRRNNYGKNSKY